MQVVIGVDPHKASRTAVAIGNDESELATIKVCSTRKQALRRSLGSHRPPFVTGQVERGGELSAPTNGTCGHAGRKTTRRNSRRAAARLADSQRSISSSDSKRPPAVHGSRRFRRTRRAGPFGGGGQGGLQQHGVVAVGVSASYVVPSWNDTATRHTIVEFVRVGHVVVNVFNMSRLWRQTA